MNVNKKIMEWVIDKTHLKIEAKGSEESTSGYVGKMVFKGLIAPIVLLPASAVSICWYTGNLIANLAKIISSGTRHQNFKNDLSEVVFSIITLLVTSIAILHDIFLISGFAFMTYCAFNGFFSFYQIVLFLLIFTLLFATNSLFGILPLKKISNKLDIKRQSGLGSTST